MGGFREYVVVVATLIAVAGCTIGGESKTPATVTVTSSAPPTHPETTTAADAATSPSATQTPSMTSSTSSSGLPTGVGLYADGFVRAWGIGDRDAASRYASATAVSSLFAYDGRGGNTWVRDASTEQDSRTQVKYIDGTGQALYVLVDTAAAQEGSRGAVVGANAEWEIHDDVPVPDDWDIDIPASGLPSTVTEYADAFVRAWGVDAISMDDYATDEVVATLYANYGSGGSNWSRSSSTATTVTYTNTDGSMLVLSLDTMTVSAGNGEGITDARVS